MELETFSCLLSSAAGESSGESLTIHSKLAWYYWGWWKFSKLSGSNQI
jgi:hypothetical protein